jgi:hypothetical protein
MDNSGIFRKIERFPYCFIFLYIGGGKVAGTLGSEVLTTKLSLP